MKTSTRIALWAARLAVALVFVVNVQAAVSFLLFPENYLASYELSGVPGTIALQGLAIAFLMWNATYPLVIVDPYRYRVVFGIVLAQQVIGLVGESILLLTMESGHAQLSESILRFISFDSFGLLLMGLAALALALTLKKTSSH